MTGHSLGAGAAVLVALYLRNYFPNVYCWAFCPPGGLAEPSVAEAAKTFCTSVAMGKDWIPRLTLKSFEHLRDEMVRIFYTVLYIIRSLKYVCNKNTKFWGHGVQNGITWSLCSIFLGLLRSLYKIKYSTTILDNV